MDTKESIKQYIRSDFEQSGESLGKFAFKRMNLYDNLNYELIFRDAKSRGRKIEGSAMMDDLDKLHKLIIEFEITGDYIIRITDPQKQFFLLLAEIQADIESQNKTSGYTQEGQ